MASAMAAAMSATAADDAQENAATTQTGAMGEAQAAKASEYATAAHAAYEAAKTASEAAAEATTITAAVRAQADAEDAAADAAEAAMKAASYSGHAVASAAGELKIAGTVKSVGDTTLDATAGASTVTTGEDDDARTVRTGELKTLAPMTTGAAVTGVPYERDNDNTADGDQTTAYVQDSAARPLTIGKVVDSADDTARLMIITKYAGTKTVNVFSMGATPVMGTAAGSVDLTPDDTTDQDESVKSLKSEGTFYRAGVDTDASLSSDDPVAAMTKGVEVFSYLDNEDPPPGSMWCLRLNRQRLGLPPTPTPTSTWMPRLLPIPTLTLAEWRLGSPLRSPKPPTTATSTSAFGRRSVQPRRPASKCLPVSASASSRVSATA